MCPSWRRRYGRCWKASRSNGRGVYRSATATRCDARRACLRAWNCRLRLLPCAVGCTCGHPLGRQRSPERLQRCALGLSIDPSPDGGNFGPAGVLAQPRASAAQSKPEWDGLHGRVDLDLGVACRRPGRDRDERGGVGASRVGGSSCASGGRPSSDSCRQLSRQGPKQLLLWHPHPLDALERALVEPDAPSGWTALCCCGPAGGRDAVLPVGGCYCSRRRAACRDRRPLYLLLSGVEARSREGQGRTLNLFAMSAGRVNDESASLSSPPACSARTTSSEQI